MLETKVDALKATGDKTLATVEQLAAAALPMRLSRVEDHDRDQDARMDRICKDQADLSETLDGAIRELKGAARMLRGIATVVGTTAGLVAIAAFLLKLTGVWK